MAYSNEALAFSQIPPSHQIRLEDRISFAYLERANVIQDRTGVVALSQIDGRNTRRSIQIPVGGISVLYLDPEPQSLTLRSPRVRVQVQRWCLVEPVVRSRTHMPRP